MMRNFTFVDDIIESIKRLIKKPPKKSKLHDLENLQPNESWAPFKIFNIGNSNRTPLIKFIKTLEKELGKKAIKEYLPIQPGDVPSTEADTNSLEEWINFKPGTSIEVGISKFVSWYKEFYNL